MTYVVTFILRKQLKERGQEGDEMGGHLVQLVEIGVGVDIAETGPDGLIDKQQVGELVPRTVVVRQGLVVLQSIRANLHQRAIHRATPRASIQPDDGALTIGDMTVLEMPEEKVPVVLRIYLNVPSGIHVSDEASRMGRGHVVLTQHASSTWALRGHLAVSEHSSRPPT